MRIFTTLAILAAVLGGCGDGGKPATPPAASKGKIGLSVLALTNPFFKEIADSMAVEARKHGYEVVAVSGEFDVARQQNQVKDFIAQKVVAIVLTPCDSKAIGTAVKEAGDAGIPVFTADIACLAPGAKVITHVATDNYQGGILAGKAMIEALGGKGKVAILDHPEVESVILRTKGFKDELEAQKKSHQITIVAELPGGGARDKSFKATQDLLQSHSDLAGIFASNDPSALGAVAALEGAGKLAQVKVVGFDGQPEGKQAIKQGKIYADPIQFPDVIGVETVRAIVKHFRGEKLDAQLLIPTQLYRKADADKDASLK